ncbi:hypothetical protein G3O08_19225 [Cryomorpha ignava]|uniref:Uncharacterized protein n=1 Tax=Cryomorpha ignava TaxID=101383 RepID=A0A7K3WVB0_9FLAO|nr:hypothetical protein [Cryomorpha ignava]NEN25629.1 hypothetical protein [Cryomorpha ignava]
MKAIKFLILVLFVTIFNNILFGFANEASCGFLANNQDSLIIRSIVPEKELVIHEGDKIQIWLLDKSIYLGNFVSLNGDSLQLSMDDRAMTFHVDQIKKLKLYSSTAAQIAGTVLIVIGAAAIVVSGAGLILGAIFLSIDTIFIGAFIISGILTGGLGFGILKIGEAITGRKCNLQNRWHIVH